jgi:TolB-like protein
MRNTSFNRIFLAITLLHVIGNLGLLSATPVDSPTSPFKSIAILDFVGLNEQPADAGLVRIISDALEVSFKEVRGFEVIPRVATEKAIKAKAIQNTDLKTEETAVAIGKQLQADFMIIGIFESIDTNPMRLILKAKIVEVSTGRIVETDSQEILRDNDLNIGISNLSDRVASSFKVKYPSNPAKPDAQSVDSTGSKLKFYDKYLKEKLFFGISAGGSIPLSVASDPLKLGFFSYFTSSYKLFKWNAFTFAPVFHLGYGINTNASWNDLQVNLGILRVIGGIEVTTKFPWYTRVDIALVIGAGSVFSKLKFGQSEYASSDFSLMSMLEGRYLIKQNILLSLAVGNISIFYTGTDFHSLFATLGVGYQL